MTDKTYYSEDSKTIHLRVWALGQMVWGAFLGGVGLVGIGLVLLVLYGLGLLLPEESKTAPDPNQRAAVELVAPDRAA